MGVKQTDGAMCLSTSITLHFLGDCTTEVQDKGFRETPKVLFPLQVAARDRGHEGCREHLVEVCDVYVPFNDVL